MSITQRQRDKYGNNNSSPGSNCIEGSAARTRPFSFEEIMLRRRSKDLVTDAKEDAGNPGDIPEKGHTETVSDQLRFDGGNKLKKDSKDMGRGSLKKKEEILSNKEGVHSKHKDKVRHDLEVDANVKSGYEKSNRDKEIKKEKQSQHRSRTDERLRPESEKEPEKKLPRDAIVKDKHGGRDRKSDQENKRKHYTGSGEKSRSEMDGSISKKHDFSKRQDLESSERKGRKYEEPRAKRRRSRSREYERDRDRRSFSISPRSQKRSYHGRDHGDYSSYKDRSGKQYVDADKYRPSGNGGFEGGRYRRRGSGLGGYSPRKRRTESAVKTPSPTTRSPEKKNATWDQPPSGTNHTGSAPLLRNLQSSATSVHDLISSTPAASTAMKPQLTSLPVTTSVVSNISIDSVQLTQATRPMRRLYIENLPASATEKAIIEWINGFLLSSGVNHIQGTLRCISCIMNKEKCQALVEFLTPEDATMALSFDGRSFSGSILKIKRPKDFLEAATGASEKPVKVVNAISDVVKDSPHKIFIGGISNALTSDMLLEIILTFGPLKAYHFEINQEFHQPCAFLEYVDQSITLKACAGLNGMKLGGSILTVVKALSDIHLEEEITEGPPSYSVPDHAKPLLENPTQVLKLKNMFDREEFLLLSEPELEETLEDIRLECARFGTIKSINIVRHSNDVTTKAVEEDLTGESGKVEASEEHITTEAVERDLIDGSEKVEDGEEHIGSDTQQNGDGISLRDATEPQDFGKVLENAINDDNAIKDPENASSLAIDETQGESHLLDTTEDHPSGNTDVAVHMEDSPGVENGLVAMEAAKEEDVSTKVEQNPVDSDTSFVGKCDIASGNGKHHASNQDVFEPGCICVEFLREEAACMAAHCLNGRLFGGRVVAAAYIAHDLYRAQFPR